jgi:hypothetical protein
MSHLRRRCYKEEYHKIPQRSNNMNTESAEKYPKSIISDAATILMKR